MVKAPTKKADIEKLSPKTLSDIAVRVKIILLCLLGLEWDAALPTDIKKRWLNWCAEMKCLKTPEFPRKFFHKINYTQLSVHIFCDATPRAFGAVAYFRYTDENKEIKTSFIMAKSRIAPLKSLTLPRCELMGAVVAARLAKYLKHVLPMLSNNIIFWSDSQITLHWIRKSPNVWKPFVGNRVAEIQAICNANQWYHCSSKENPADLLSRGERAETIISSPLWQNGPSWLIQPENLWPKRPSMEENEEEISVEKRKTHNVLQAVINNKDSEQSYNSLLDLNQFSKLNKVYRITAWIYRFINNSNPRSERLCGLLSASEIMNAEKILD
ncbi:uncharacterized protein LOC118199008 [Stegodyphus dumicola]|uniref:uncharacterized protein LOC118199008 n=1 Tax=Stegodyphus dumicola TaxID=202533 RepID=UPI0015ADCE03|nr:uncharacterized protein LOC118199008 [Stegodyphus dumicola]